MDLLGLLMATSFAESRKSFPSRSLLFPRLPTQDEAASVSEHPTVLTSSAQCQAPDASSSTLQAHHEVTLVTQASVERLWMVPHICARWGEAPMVVVALAHDANRLEWPRLGRGARCALTCLELRTTSSGLNNPEKYPINWLRNQGILCVKTTHYFVVDVDFWPSVELLDCIRRQLGTWGDSARALVIPNFQRNGHGCRNDVEQLACRHAFEKDAIGMPNNFSDLRDCLAAKDCSVFDVEYNPQGQSSTDIQAWLSRERHDTYAIPCLVSERYEPFVVLQRTSHTPLFDERFHGYGKNKVQLLVHLRYAGYKFDALTRGFVIHFPHPKSVAKQKWLHSGAHARVESLFNTFHENQESRGKGMRRRRKAHWWLLSRQRRQRRHFGRPNGHHWAHLQEHCCSRKFRPRATMK
ncbi:hypothetical protein AB1Y20_015160 [Prymnesium parvum]|uniref:Glycosyltransferase-like protein LARGE2 n=1 Tax=Prymnesium parvum TaxID=97485 RepID=A0AB34JZU7_PRYPA